MGSILLDFDCKGNPDFMLGARIERANRAAVLRGIAVARKEFLFERRKLRFPRGVTLVQDTAKKVVTYTRIPRYKGFIRRERLLEKLFILAQSTAIT